MKDLSLKQLQDLKEKWYLESDGERHEFICACEEFGKEMLLKGQYLLIIEDFEIFSDAPAIRIKKSGITLCNCSYSLFVSGDWIEELRGLIANLRAERKEEQQRQELLKQLNPFGAV